MSVALGRILYPNLPLAAAVLAAVAGTCVLGAAECRAADPEAPPLPPATTPAAPATDAPALEEEIDPSRVHFSMGADYTTAYFFRGFAYEDSGLIVQPFADFSLDVFRGEEATVSVILGFWNSLHGQATDAGTEDDLRKYWFECDLYAGAGIEIGPWTLGAQYNWYTSPSDAWDTVEEIAFSASYDDAELFEGWSLQPYALVAIETGSTANDGVRKGAYLELGVSPGFTFDAGVLKELELRFPVTVGLSLSNYYEDGEGGNDVFGFASVGAAFSLPLPLDESWGAWSLHAGVQGLFLGDVTASANGGDDFQVIGTIGILVEF